MINVGWYFYRNYLNQDVIKEIDKHKREIKDKKRLNEAIQKVFEKQNTPILNTTWDDQKRVSILASTQIISLKTTYPGLFSGSGIAHGTGETGEFKLGFAFDHITGQPYLAGSSVKGTIRSAFPFRLAELATKQIKKDKKESDRMFAKAKVLLEEYLLKIDCLKNDKEIPLSAKQLFQLEWEIFEGVKITNLDKIWNDDLTKINFSKLEIESIGSYERDIFYDAFISEPNSTNKILGKDFITPHKHKTNRNLDALVNPIPIQFLKILPNVTFQFNFDLKPSTFDGICISADVKKQLFRQILLEFGIGAKTNVGYGQFE